MAGATTQVCIGVVAPLTGRLAPLGEPLSFAVRALAPRLARLHNGGRAYDVRVAVRDSRSDPQTARQAVAELAVRDRARIILTMAGTQVLPAATDACERLSVPCVSTTFPWQAYGYARGGDPLRAFRWTYHFAWGLDDIADVFADVWERIGERQTVGCLWNDDLQGRLLRHGRYGFAPVASGRGHCLVDPGGYAESAPEFDAHVARFREQDARIVTSAATAEDLARYYGRARAAGFIPRLITCSRWLTYPHTHTSTSADVHAALAAARVATLVYWSPAHPYRSGLDGSTCADLARAYREATGRGWLQPLGLAHALFEVARHALTTAPDPTDRAAIAHTLGKTRTETVVGPLDWTRGPTPNVALRPPARRGGQHPRARPPGHRRSGHGLLRPAATARSPVELSAGAPGVTIVRTAIRGAREVPVSEQSAWPRLRVADWTETRDTLHMWTQIVGKIRLAHAPLVNHWWQVTLYVTPRGLTTSTVPYGSGAFDIEFDFIEHRLVLRTSDGQARHVKLEPKSVARFYEETLRALDELGIQAPIQPHPNEVETAIPFPEDTRHASYDPHAAHQFWRQLLQVDRVLSAFRSRFMGKVSPVHFFWGAMDLACTRFSGRPAPAHPGGAPHCGDWVMVEGYSRELSSCGFWPGGGEEGAFYAYAYPEPAGFRDHPVEPSSAYYSEQNGQFLLPYEAVRTADDPDATLTGFLQSTYEAAAEHAGWGRDTLEEDPGRWDRQRARAHGAR